MRWTRSPYCPHRTARSRAPDSQPRGRPWPALLVLVALVLLACGEVASPTPPATPPGAALEDTQARFARAEAMRMTDPRAAIRLYEQTLPQLQPADRAHALNRMGFIWLTKLPQEPATTGLAWLEQGVAEAERAGAWCTWVGGIRHLVQHDIDGAQPDLARDEARIEAAVRRLEGCEPLEQSRVWLVAARVRRQLGRQSDQFEALLKARDTAPPDHAARLFAEFELAELYHDLGDVTDEGETYRALLDQAIKLERFDRALDILLALAVLQQDLGELEAARRTLLEAEQLARAHDFDGDRWMAYALLTENALRQGDKAAAGDWYARIPADAGQGDLLRRQQVLQQARAQLLEARGDRSGARQLLQAIADAPDTELERRWRAHAELARLARAEGDTGSARRLLWSTVDELERQREATSEAFWTLGYLSQRQGLYVSWLTELVAAWERDGERPSRPDGSKWRPDQVFVQGPVTADDLLAAVEKISSQALTASLYRDRGAIAGGGGLDARLSRLAAGGWVDGPTLRALLPPDLPCLIYQPLEREILLLEVWRDRVIPYRIPFRPEHVAAVRALQAAMNQMSGERPAALELLGELLLKPVSGHLPGPDRPLAVVLQGELQWIPFAALYLEGRYLVEHAAPFELPNLTSLRALEARPRPKGPLKALAVAYGEDIPAAAREVELLRRPGLETTVLQDEDARLERVAAAMTAPDVLHFAAHAVSVGRSEPLSSLLPTRGAPAARAGDPSPARAHIRLAGGYLTVETLQRMRLRARLTVLSGCRTRLGAMRFQEHSPGALHRAALVAGSEAVIASRWKVGDEATFALMSAFYARYPETGRALALARAQRAMLASRQVSRRGQARPAYIKGEFPGGAAPGAGISYSAPWSWAAFSLVGRWD